MLKREQISQSWSQQFIPKPTQLFLTQVKLFQHKQTHFISGSNEYNRDQTCRSVDGDVFGPSGLVSDSV